MSETWNHCLKNLKHISSVEEYTKWIQPIRAKESTTLLKLTVPDRQTLTWINQNLKYTINGLIAQKSAQLSLRIEPRSAPKPNLSNLTNKLSGPLIAEYTFENLVVGDSNQIAHHAGLEIANNPRSSSYFPFIIYGDCGIGKSHLLHAIGHLAKQKDSQLNIMFIPLIEFVKNITNGIRHRQIETIKKCYQAADLLLVDDIHHIADKEKSQEEFFHIFNYLFQNKKQIVLTCDQVPRSLRKIESRLISRFNQGLILEIKKPALEMRAAILSKKAEAIKINLSADDALFIASKFTNNVRELEGALNRLKLIKNFTNNSKLNIDQIKEALKDLIDSQQKIIGISDIQKTVCRYYGINTNNLLSKNRNKNLVYPRQMAMHLAKRLTGLSLAEIGQSFKKDHTTVIHADKKINLLLKNNKSAQEDYKNLTIKINDI